MQRFEYFQEIMFNKCENSMTEVLEKMEYLYRNASKWVRVAILLHTNTKLVPPLPQQNMCIDEMCIRNKRTEKIFIHYKSKKYSPNYKSYCFKQFHSN